MRNARVSKLIAVAMAATMLMSSATVFAADTDVTDPTQAGGEISGDGKLEGYVDKNVFRIVLPTIANANFTVDPQGLLKVADSTKYTLGPGAVYFTNAPTTEGGTATYSDTSDEIKFVNKSSYDVKVGLNITLTADGVSLAKAADIATATEPSISLGLIKGTDAAVDIDSTNFKSADAEVKAVPEVNASATPPVTAGYTVKGSTTAIDGVDPSPNGYYYTYALTDGYTAGADQTVTYKLKGSCNNVEGWSKVNQAVKAKIAWSVADTRAPKDPSITGTTYSRSKTDNTYALENVTQNITSIQAAESAADGATVYGAVPSEAYSVDSGKTTLTIDGTKNTVIGAGGVGKSRCFIITFADGSELKLTVNVTA